MCGPLVPEVGRTSPWWRRTARSPRAVLLAVLALCVVLRGAGALAVLLTNPHAVVQVDSASYLRPALALLNDSHFLQSRGSHQPEFVRTPGYPAFIAFVYLVFGVSHAALLLAQVVVSTLTVLVVWRLGVRMWSAPNRSTATSKHPLARTRPQHRPRPPTPQPPRLRAHGQRPRTPPPPATPHPARRLASSSKQLQAHTAADFVAPGSGSRPHRGTHQRRSGETTSTQPATSARLAGYLPSILQPPPS
jgi:hypothetical protein